MQDMHYEIVVHFKSGLSTFIRRDDYQEATDLMTDLVDSITDASVTIITKDEDVWSGGDVAINGDSIQMIDFNTRF